MQRPGSQSDVLQQLGSADSAEPGQKARWSKPLVIVSQAPVSTAALPTPVPRGDTYDSLPS